MDTVWFDTETHPVRRGLLAPPLVCMSWATSQGGPHIAKKERARKVIETMLREAKEIVAYNTAFDMSVICANWPELMPLVFQAYDEGRVKCLKVRLQLRAIAIDRFKFDPALGHSPAWRLGEQVMLHLGKEMNKEQDLRTGFAKLEDVPLEDWDKEVIDYVLDDTGDLRDLWLKFKDEVPPDEDLQVRADFGLYLMQSWGLRVDHQAVLKLKEDIHTIIKAGEPEMVALGFYRAKRKSDGQLPRNMANIEAAVVQAYEARGWEVPVTAKTGKPSTSADTLALSADPALLRLSDMTKTKDLLTKFVKHLDGPLVQPRFYVLVRSGRTSCRRPNMQNPPRRRECHACRGKGKVEFNMVGDELLPEPLDCQVCEGTGALVGFRECFIPRPGWVYLDADYSGAELVTLAEVCQVLFGFSNLGDVLRAGQDPHLVTGAELAHTSYEDLKARYEAGEKQAKEFRQLAKPLNFGIPGGLGRPATFVEYARTSYGVIVEPEEVPALKASYLQKFPEVQELFNFVGSKGADHKAVQIHSGRVRAGLNFTNGCNTYFQGLAADGAKDALYHIVRACYTEGSWLSGCRMVNFVHDQFLVECPEARAEEALEELVKVMCEKFQPWVPSVPIQAEGKILTRWEK